MWWRQTTNTSSLWGSSWMVETPPSWCLWLESWSPSPSDSRTVRRWTWSSPPRTSRTISPSGASTSSGATSPPSPVWGLNCVRSTPALWTARPVVFPPLRPWQTQAWVISTSMVMSVWMSGKNYINNCLELDCTLIVKAWIWIRTQLYILWRT